MANLAEELVVRSEVEVPLARDAAFRLFVDRLADWWPLTSHSVFQDEARSVSIGQEVGGRIVETAADGRRAEWGVVTTWDAPTHIGFTWYPGQDSTAATQVEIGFHERPEGGTRVELVHTGWEARGADAKRLATSYGPGWGQVLGEFRRLAEGAE